MPASRSRRRSSRRETSVAGWVRTRSWRVRSVSSWLDDVADARGPQTEVGDCRAQHLVVAAAARAIGPRAGLASAHEGAHPGQTGEETPARRVLAAGILRVDPHQVAHAHLARLETLAEREHVAHAGCRCEGLGRDRALAGRDALAEVDLGLAGEEGRASDPAQVGALGVGYRGRPAGRAGRLGR